MKDWIELQQQKSEKNKFNNLYSILFDYLSLRHASWMYMDYAFPPPSHWALWKVGESGVRQ
jgi:hypothetical protein